MQPIGRYFAGSTALALGVLLGTLPSLALPVSPRSPARAVNVALARAPRTMHPRTAPLGAPTPSGNGVLQKGGTVLVVGDSISFDLGQALSAQLAQTPLLVRNQGKPTSGLAVPAFYDWPAKLGRFLNLYHPQVVVVLLGANDDQGLYANGHAAAFASTEWQREYARRVNLLVAETKSAGAQLLWLSPPQMQDPTYDGYVSYVAGVARQAVMSSGFGTWVSTRNVLTTTPGQFQLTGVVNGTVQQIRYADGIHPTTAGSALLASFVVKLLRSDFGYRGPAHDLVSLGPAKQR